MRHHVGSAAAAVALITALGACSADDPSATPSTAGDTAPSSATTDCPSIAASFTDLEVGCWTLSRPGLPLAAQVTVPDGFTGGPDAVWLHSLDDPDWGHLSLTTTGDVWPDPCSRSDAPPPNSATIDDFAEALAAQRVTRTSKPVPVAVGGHDGLYLTLSVAADFAMGRCTDGELQAWQEEGEGISQPGPDEVMRLWVIDVDGQGLVLVMHTRPDPPRPTVERLSAVAESATFVDG